MTVADLPATDSTTLPALRRGAPVVRSLTVVRVRPVIVIVLVALAVAAITSPAPRPVAAQDASGLTVSLTPSITKAKVGDIVRFIVRIENTGIVTIPALSVNLELPDALNAQSVTCPGDRHGSTTFCDLGDFAPDSVAEVVFFVEVGSR